MGDKSRPRLSNRTQEALSEIMEEYELNSYDQAIRHALRELGYDV